MKKLGILSIFIFSFFIKSSGQSPVYSTYVAGAQKWPSRIIEYENYDNHIHAFGERITIFGKKPIGLKKLADRSGLIRRPTLHHI